LTLLWGAAWVKTRSITTAPSAWASGTKAAAAFLFAFLAVSSCQHKETEQQQASDLKLAEEDEYDLDVTPNAAEANQKKSRLPHPNRPSASQTKILVMNTNMPPQTDLDGCRKELDALSEYATSQETLILAMQKFSALIGEDVDLYHWCFYYSMLVLDNKLENDGLGVYWEEKNKKFAENMKSLWILALSLDKNLNTTSYFTYLQTRYVQISREYFAKELDVVATPLGGNLTAPSKKKDKAAYPFEDLDY
jgi:hypothetical protein